MEHQKLENMASTALMLPKENGDEKVVILTPGNGVGKILIREDTILANLQGCACGRAQFTCGGVEKQWSVLCWGHQSDRKYYCLVTLLSATFVLSLIGTVFFCFTNTINDAILSNMVIRNNSLAYSIWQRPNVNPLMKVHLFNYTNWEDVVAGKAKKLRVEDVGPYVYSQQIERVHIEFDKDRVTFQEHNNFRFLPDKSKGTEMDRVQVPNLPLLGVISKALDMNLNNWVQMTLDTFLWRANHKNAFLKLPVARFLWGYDDDIIDTAKPFLSILGQLPFEKFGLLVTKNGTVSDRLTINTGEYVKERMNMIERLNGEAKLHYWTSEECNNIQGSDGSIFPPHLLDRKTRLHVFYPNLCRRLPFIYERDVEISDGIQLMRYRMPDNVFDHPDNNTENHCFCEIDSGTCPLRGVINVTACTMGVPALVSFPHFYLGDPKLYEDIEGLQPNRPALYENFLDLHPTLGIALSGKSSLQLNIQMRKSEMFTALKNLPQGLILPIAWLEMGVEELPESLRSLVYHGTYSTAAVQLGLIVTSVIALIVSGICLCLLLVRKRQKPCVTLKKVPGDTELKVGQFSR